MPDNANSGTSGKDLFAELNEQLLEAQFELRKAGKGPVLLLIAGNDFAGKAEVIDTFYQWLDNRFLNTRAFALPRGLEKQMPPFWRYCRALPLAGEIGFYLGSWYHQPLRKFSRGETSVKRFTAQMQDILRFERLLVHEGATVLKLWLHLDAEDEDGQARSEKTQTSETIAMREWSDFSAADYQKVRSAAQLMIDLTSVGGAPWIRVAGRDAGQRDLEIGQLLLDTLRSCLNDEKQTAIPRSWIPSTRPRLDELDYSQALSKDDYKALLEHYQNRLRELLKHPGFARRSLLLVFEGTDAAGKGGTIRRITQCLDPRFLRVHGTRAPTDEEKLQPYLMRFWRRIPRPGTIVVFDRSYYGRVLVERVEGFCTPAQWQRAYGEINDFEQQLRQAGTLVIKFWLAITPEEQLDRFNAREESPLKRYKLTDEDWRNREKWPAYRDAVHDMLEFTSTENAPWHLISSENKKHGRIEALKIVCETLEQALD
ncbi:polyphosphate:AMP phosphotransferase [Halopseudomonas sp.]|uniref:polyphosphate:AMP phosphotransferase n=1 Tax=Halopseudomonas sp. TaxID=2901191 RepID=UPI0035668FFB